MEGSSFAIVHLKRLLLSLLRTCEYCVSLRTCGEGTPSSSIGGLRGFGHGEENDYNDDNAEEEEEEEEEV